MSLAWVAPAASAIAWIAAVSWRVRGGRFGWVTRTVAGGTFAFAAALCGYALLEANGIRISWSDLVAGGGGSVAAAAAIGLVEESAKLLGLAMTSVGAAPADRGAIVRRILGVSAVFAALECAFTLREVGAAVILLRAAFAPVAHAALALPLGLALVGGARGRRRIVPALAAAAFLHGASDLALAVPALGRIGYAAILAAPAVALHLRARAGWARGAAA